MKNLKKIILSLLIILVGTSLAQAQNGLIRGTVYDDVTAEELPGVTVYIEGTTIGAMTDFDGKFSLSVAAGIYDVRVSFISYETINIKGLEVKAGEVTLLDNLRLKEANIQLGEVVVSAELIRNNEAALLTVKKKSANLLDGISSANFRKIGDSDAASSMKRVPGVSVEGGKYIYVRGLGDRYTKAILNGVDIPGLDPDRNTLQMDIFPTNVIENIVVMKSFTADLPADFTGGVIDIATKEFPEELSAGVSVSAGYNPAMHFNNNYLTYAGGKTDWLGYDDGTRAIPATENIPLFSEVVGNANGEKGLRYQEILRAFNPTLAAIEKQSFMDYSIGASIGNQHSGEKVTWGYNVALSYKNETEYYKDAEYGRYGVQSDPGIFEMENREFQKGNYGVNNVLVSGLAGLALKTKASKYKLNFLRLQNGESKAGIFDYQKSNQGTVFNGFQHNLEYSQRELTNVLLSGVHYFGGNKWEVEWKLSPTLSEINDPDIRFTRYEDREGVYHIGTESGFPERIWRELKEVNYSGILHITKDYTFRGEKAKLKFGGAYVAKERDFVIRNFALNIRNLQLTGDPNELFLPENIWPVNGSVGTGTTYEAPFIPTNPNQYNAQTTNTAAYVSTELSPFNRLKAIVGVRAEDYKQRYTGQDQQGVNVLDNELVLDKTSFFPTVNLIYSLTENQNLRFSYAKTIARPSFKELSYAEIFDPITGRTFIGGLFRDANDVANIVYWDGNLQSTDIQNLDLRWETFQPGGQTISVSGFYKQFNRPIELVQYITLVGAFQPRNVGDGQVFGAELEVRRKLGFLGENLSNFAFNANFTLTKSRIKLSTTEYQSRLENARTGQSIDEYRDMAGQAPYLINAGVAYEGGTKGFWQGFEAGIYYNVQGKTLAIVGIVDRPDIYTLPFNSLNLNVNKRFGKDNRMQLGLKIDNLLSSRKESVFESYEATDEYFTRLSPGTKMTLRFSYDIF